MEYFDGNDRYHNAIKFNSLVFMSGQTATEVGDTIASQTEAVLEKIARQLEKYGSDKDHMLHADVYLKNQSDVAEFNAIWDKWISPHCAPTRALMVTDLGRPPILVEIVVVAAEV